MAPLLAVAPAGAAAPSGKAFSWGYKHFGQLGNDTSGPGTSSGIPAVNVKNLSITNQEVRDGELLRCEAVLMNPTERR